MTDTRGCDLCGLDIGAKPLYLEVGAKKRLQFCCEGCLGIYQILHDTEPPTADTDTNQPKGEHP